MATSIHDDDGSAGDEKEGSQLQLRQAQQRVEVELPLDMESKPSDLDISDNEAQTRDGALLEMSTTRRVLLAGIMSMTTLLAVSLYFKIAGGLKS